MAEGLLKQRTAELGVGKRVLVDSAGIRVGRPGQRPDPRAQVQLLKLGINIRRCRARAVEPRDFQRFDYILGMSGTHMAWLSEQAGEKAHARLSPILGFASPEDAIDVPDPYYGKEAEFAQVLTLLQGAVDGFVEAVLKPELQARELL